MKKEQWNSTRKRRTSPLHKCYKIKIANNKIMFVFISAWIQLRHLQTAWLLDSMAQQVTHYDLRGETNSYDTFRSQHNANSYESKRNKRAIVYNGRAYDTRAHLPISNFHVTMRKNELFLFSLRLIFINSGHCFDVAVVVFCCQTVHNIVWTRLCQAV